MMYDTVAVVNPLTITSTSYNNANSSLTLTIGSTNLLAAKAVQMGVWHGSTDAPDFGTTGGAEWVNIATVKATNPYLQIINDPLFAADTHTVYVAIALMGSNHVISKIVRDTVVVGTVRPQNTITLHAAALGSFQIRLTWSRADSVRIWYGDTIVPLAADFSSGRLTHIEPARTDTSITISTFQPLTTYYFGLQVWGTGLWSLVTPGSSAQATTDSVSSALKIKNTAAFDTAYFDTATNMVRVVYRVDTAGIGAKQLQLGVRYGLSGIPWADTGAMEITDVRRVNDTISFGIKGQPASNATYYLSLWLRALSQNSSGPWAAPTDSSTGSFFLAAQAWVPVTFFQGTDTLVSTFSGKVLLLRSATWGRNTINDTLDVYARPVPSSSGMISGGMGFTFRAGLQCPPVYIGFKLDALPNGIDSLSQLRIYRDSAGIFTVMRDSVHVSGGVVWALANNLHLPFVLMADMVHPTITFASPADTQAVLTPLTTAGLHFSVGDNIANVIWTVRYGRGNAGYEATRSDTLTSTSDSAIVLFPADMASPDYGLRAIIIVSDGVHVDTINVSRRVSCTNSDEIATVAQGWTPIRVTAALNDTTVSTALKFAISETNSWTYDNTVFRMFRWYSYPGNANAASDHKWVEYSDAPDLFGLVPGRVFWIKTALQQDVNFGAGISTSLKEPYNIILPAKDWTDFSLPYKFAINLRDVLAATGPSGDTLQYYSWISSGKSYSATEMYIAHVPSLDTARNTARFVSSALSDAYTVYNPTDNNIVLRIPAVPVPLSKPVALSKRARSGGWDVWLRWRADASTAQGATVRCGYAPGMGKTMLFPLAPSFGDVVAGVHTTAGSMLYGHAILDKANNGGFFYEVRFVNHGVQEHVVHARLEHSDALPGGMRAILFDPAKGGAVSATDWQDIPVDANSTAYRWVVVGSQAYVNDFAKNFKPYAMRLAGVFPNPATSRVTIRYTVPYTGLRELSFAIYDIAGRRVWNRAVMGPFTVGDNSLLWNGQNALGRPVAAGTYFLRMAAVESNSNKTEVFKTRLIFLPR
jgi:hypothetical protein